MSVRSRLGAIAALSVIALVTAANASALTIKDVHKHEVLIEPSTLSVRCPKGTHVVSGGASASSGALTATKKKRNGWTASGTETAAGADLRVDAYCASKDLHLKTASHRSATTPITESLAACPAGTNLISGGASVGLGQGLLKSSTPNVHANGWYVNAGPGASTSLTAYAYCTPRRMHLDWRTQAGTGGPVTALCRTGEVPLSGGAEVSSNYLSESRRTSSGWLAFGTGDLDTFTAVAGCW